METLCMSKHIQELLYFHATIVDTPVKVTMKPYKSAYSSFHQRARTQHINLHDLMNALKEGNPIYPSAFTPAVPNRENFKSCQLLYVDMDTMTSIEDTLDLCASFGLKPNLYHQTFSSSPEKPRYRLYFLLDQPIEKYSLMANLARNVANILGGDLSCEPTKCFLPGFDYTLFSYTPNYLLNPILVGFIDTTKNILTNKLYSPTIRREHRRKILNQTSNTVAFLTRKAPSIRNFDYEHVCSISSVFNGFDKGSIHLKYHQLRCLVLNMMHVLGGMSYVERKMNLDAVKTTYKPEDFALLKLPLIIQKHHKTYSPENIETFDSSLRNQYRNILDISAQRYRSGVRRLKPVEKDSFVSAQKNFYDNFDKWDMLPNDVKSKTCIKGPCGIGKTQYLYSFLLQNPKTTVLFANHDLLDEFAAELACRNIPFERTPRPLKFSNNPELTALVTNSYEHFPYNQTRDLLLKIANNVENKYSDEESRYVKQYFSAINRAKYSEIPVLSTHCRGLLYNVSSHNTVIFDEDNFLASLPVYSMDFEQLLVLLEGLQKESFQSIGDNPLTPVVAKDLSNLLSFFRNISPNTIIPFVGSFYLQDVDALYRYIGKCHKKSLGKVLELLSSHYISLVDNSIVGVKRRNSATGQKELVLSGTADPWLYKLFNTSVDFFDAKPVKNKTKIVQFMSKPWFKKHIFRLKPDEVAREFNLPHDVKIISFKGMRSFENLVVSDHYFFNAHGTNKLEGHPVVVIGTPLVPVHVTLMIHRMLDLPLYESYTKKYRKVKLDDFEFSIFTYIDENLAQIELRLAKAELTQAASRSRAISHNVNVYIFSSIPCEIADMHLEDQDALPTDWPHSWPDRLTAAETGH